MRKFEDLTPAEKNEICDAFVAPSEQKLINLAEHLIQSGGVKIECAEDLHNHVKEFGDERIKAFYGNLVAEMFAEKDQYIREFLEKENDTD